MSFRLLRPLNLADVQTAGVNLVPTKKYFKPVLVMSCPLTAETALALNALWIFDGAGNPNSFDGAIGLSVEISGAQLTFKGKTIADVIVKTQKISSLKCSREEKDGCRLTFRAHLPEDEDEAEVVGQKLLELLAFLSKLNKEHFEVVIDPAQLRLPGLDVKEVAGAPFSEIGANTKPFSIPMGKKVGIVGHVQTVKHGDGFLGGWEVKAVGFKEIVARGESCGPDSRIHETEEAAFTWACAEGLHYAKQLTDNANPKELDAIATLSDWFLSTAPSLKILEADKLK